MRNGRPWYTFPWRTKTFVEPKSIVAAVGYVAAAILAVVLAVTTPRSVPVTVGWGLFVVIFALAGGTLIATLLWLRRTNARR
jgi:hypothetical protein